MSTELIINASLPETRIALMEDGEIQEILVERASGKGIVGNIYKGRVTRVLPGMQAAFVDIGLEKAAFLYVDDVYTHSEIWEDQEDEHPQRTATSEIQAAQAAEGAEGAASEPGEGQQAQAAGEESEQGSEPETDSGTETDEETDSEGETATETESDESAWADHDSENDDEDEDDDGEEPVRMSAAPGGEGGDGGGEDRGSREQPSGTVAPESSGSGGSDAGAGESGGGGEGMAAGGQGGSGEGGDGGEAGRRRRRHRRGRRGGKFRRDRDPNEQRGPRQPGQVGQQPQANGEPVSADGSYPESFASQVSEEGDLGSDRSALDPNAGSEPTTEGRPSQASGDYRKEFKAQRSRDRRIKGRSSSRRERPNVSIQDLLKEGQEVIVQVAKDPIATKGARLTCHISLPGRHLVCMPTIDHVGVSRRIERDDERRKLREYVEKHRPRNLGFIVRTASGKSQSSENRIKQDIEYLNRLWEEIREKAAQVTAPALVYEDLNAVLRSIRDWVTEDIDKIIVDSRYHFNEIQRFVSHFMPSLKQKVDLYHGDLPIFDAFNISTELSRALERKVWLKSGGYIVVDQAEALVAIDVNTGRYVGKKNLEDTILKTNLEAVQEVAYQLRLRNAGGIIIIDLIDMEKEENKQRVYRALEDALKKDRARPSILKISELGLIEMTRKRTRDTMVRALCESCTHCEGKGFVKSATTVAYEILRQVEREGVDRESGKILVQAHPDVIDILAIDERDSLDQLERRYRKQVYLQAVADFHPEQFEAIGDKRQGTRVSSHERFAEGRRDRGGRDRDRGRGERGGRRGGRDRDRGGRDRNESQARGDQAPRVQIQIQPRQPGAVIIAEPQPAQGAEFANESSSMIVMAPRIQAGPEGAIPEPGNQDMSAAAGNGEVTGALGSAPRGPEDDFFSEEDRLAFLRAQAAQDAALAGKSVHGAAGNRAGGQPRGGARDRDVAGGARGGRGGARGGRGGRNARGGGAGGRGSEKFRGPRGAAVGPSNGAGRGPAPIIIPAGGGGPVAPQVAAPQVAVPMTAAPSDGGSGGGGESGGNGGGENS